jgi:hypothetical protein
VGFENSLDRFGIVLRQLQGLATGTALHTHNGAERPNLAVDLRFQPVEDRFGAEVFIVPLVPLRFSHPVAPYRREYRNSRASTAEQICTNAAADTLEMFFKGLEGIPQVDG